MPGRTGTAERSLAVALSPLRMMPGAGRVEGLGRQRRQHLGGVPLLGALALPT